MEIWVITHGMYEDEKIVMTASSEEKATEMIAACGKRDGWTDELAVYGPFELDQFNTV